MVPGPERIAARAPHRVPIGHAEAELVLHRLAFHQLVRIVVPEGQRVLGIGTFVVDLLTSGKALMGGSEWLGVVSCRMPVCKPGGCGIGRGEVSI